MNRNWEHCKEKPEKSGIDVIRKGERMLESVAIGIPLHLHYNV